MLTVALFRQRVAEFADPGPYPNIQVQVYLDLAQGVSGRIGFLDATRWGDAMDYGTQLFVSHHLVVAQRNKRRALVGGIPGTVQGPQSENTVDKVSVSYDTQAVSLENMGFWGLTTYGLEFYQLALLMGSGGVQL